MALKIYILINFFNIYDVEIIISNSIFIFICHYFNFNILKKIINFSKFTGMNNLILIKKLTESYNINVRYNGNNL